MLVRQAIFCTIYLLHWCGATLTPKSPKSSKEKAEKIKQGPVNQSVFDRNLVSENPSAKAILINHQAYYKITDESNVEGLVLGYITPWNNHGYDVAKLFANKFTHISPVWLQIRRRGALKYEVTGLHDVDKGWMQDVRKGGRNSKVKIVPRVLFDGWTAPDYQSLLKDLQEIDVLAKTLLDCCKKWNFDGVVLEVWSQIAGRVNNDLLNNFIKHVATTLTSGNFNIILVVPPKRDNAPTFTKEHFDELYDYVTAFSLMTYDFSSPQRPGPNAPLAWVEECITDLSPNKDKRRKILTGLNFYGNVFTANGGKPIVSHEYVELLSYLKGNLQYDHDSVENYFEVKTPKGRFLVFYPSLYSVNKRLNLADELGTGISIWELGQGLDYFYDLL